MDMRRQILYKLSDAARMLGVSPSTLMRWNGSGKMELIKSPSGRSMVQRKEIERLSGERL